MEEQKKKFRFSSTCQPVRDPEDLIDPVKHTYNAGRMWRHIVITMNDGTLTELFAKTKYYNLDTKKFFKAIIEAFLDDNPAIIKVVNEVNYYKVKKKIKIQRKLEQEKKKEIIEDFGFNKEELTDIFDEIEHGEFDYESI